MRILIVTSSLDDGGVARIVSDMTLLLPSDWEFDLLLSHTDDIRYDYRGEIIPLHLKEPGDRKNLLYVIRAFIRRFRTLKKLKKSGQYDICLSFMDTGNAVNILTGRKYCKTMIAIENYMSLKSKYDRKYRYIVDPTIRLLYNKADRIIVCSDEGAKDLEENYGIDPKLMERIYCSVDTGEIEKTIRESKIPDLDRAWIDPDRTVLTAGRLTLQKGQWHLIRAFKQVVEFIPDAKLVIFGDGELKSYFLQMIDEYGLQSNVTIHGYTNILPKYIDSSAVFTMPSLYEGFPTALLMALACGTACVVSDFVSGAREQLAPGYDTPIAHYHQGEYGIISAELDAEKPSVSEPLSDSEKDLADALVYILDNKEKREYYAKQAKLRSADFDSHIICDQWRDSMLRLSVGEQS